MITDFVLGGVAMFLWVYSHRDCFSCKTPCPTIFICPTKVFDNAEELGKKAKENLVKVVEKSKDAVDKAKEGFKEALGGEKEVANNADDEKVDKLSGSKKVMKTNKVKMIKGKNTKGKKSNPKKIPKSKKSIENEGTNDVTSDAKEKIEGLFKNEKNETTKKTTNTAEDKLVLIVTVCKVEELAGETTETLEEFIHTKENNTSTKTPRKINDIKKTMKEKSTNKPA